MKYKYYVSWFAKLKSSDNGLGIQMNGHVDGAIFNLSYPVTDIESLTRLTERLQQEVNQKLFIAVPLAFSLMHIDDEDFERNQKE